MIQGWLAWPLELRVLVIGLWGVAVATQLNRAIYRWAYYARAIGPWSAPDEQAPPRQWSDRIPVLGWWSLRRESALHGPSFWVRPMLVEVAFGCALAFLYTWLCQGGNLPLQVRVDPTMVHAQFLSQAFLLAWLTIATFIDFDEKMIPDFITIPGTFVGFALAYWLPRSLLPSWPDDVVEPLLFSSPLPFPERYMGWPGLAWGLTIYLAWWLAIWPKTVCFRHGVTKGLRYMIASMYRYPGTGFLFGLVFLGSVLIALAWRQGGLGWQGLLSSLIGLAWGGAMIWGVRIAGRLALRKEAMGFGDVTLLAMVGSYLGWQSTTFVFFIAPFTGVLLAVANLLITRRNDVPYGPFLAAGTVVVLFAWPTLWSHYGVVFRLGLGIPLIGFACLFLMGGMLDAWRRLTRAGGEGH